MEQSIRFSNQINKSAVPILEEPQLLYLLTEVEPGKGGAATRMPMNVVLILDQSGSMRGEKIQTLRETVKTIIDQLTPLDILSIVLFETTTHVLIPAQPVQDKTELKKAVDQIVEGGGTVLAPALREAHQQVSSYLSSDHANRAVLLTDGEVTDQESESFREADRFGITGIPLIGLGLGSAWNTNFVQELADRSIKAAPGSQKGYSDYIESPQQALPIFQQVFQSMNVVAKSVQLITRLVQGVQIRRVWEVAPMIREISRQVIQETSVSIHVGDLSNQGTAYLTEILLPARSESSIRFAQCNLHYTLPNGETLQQNQDMIVNYTSDAEQHSQVNTKVMNTFEKVTAFSLQTRALEEAAIGNNSSATRRLRQAVTILLDQGETELAQKMEQEAKNLEQGKGISEEGSKTIRLTSRKTIRLEEE